MLDLSHADVPVGHSIPLSFPLSRGQRAAEPEYPTDQGRANVEDAHSSEPTSHAKPHDLQVFFN